MTSSKDWYTFFKKKKWKETTNLNSIFTEKYPINIKAKYDFRKLKNWEILLPADMEIPDTLM